MVDDGRPTAHRSRARKPPEDEPEHDHESPADRHPRGATVKHTYRSGDLEFTRYGLVVDHTPEGDVLVAWLAVEPAGHHDLEAV